MKTNLSASPLSWRWGTGEGRVTWQLSWLDNLRPITRPLYPNKIFHSQKKKKCGALCNKIKNFKHGGPSKSGLCQLQSSHAWSLGFGFFGNHQFSSFPLPPYPSLSFPHTLHYKRNTMLNTPMLLVRLTVKETNITYMWIMLEIIFCNNKDSTGRLKFMNYLKSHPNP